MKPTYEELEIELEETHQLIEAIRKGKVDTIIGEDPEKKFFRLKSLKLEEERERLLEKLQKANERLEKVIQAKDIFLKNMAEELKNPLTEIIGYSELLLLEPEFNKNEQWRTFQKTVQTAAERFLNLIGGLFDLSRLLSGEQIYRKNREPFSIPVCSAINCLEPQLAKKEIRLLMDKEQFHVEVYIDAKQMERAIRNLLENAVHFSNEKSEIQIRGTKERDQVKLCIQDHGPGIARQELETIFRQYIQLHRRKSGLAKGPGLGLAIAKQIIEDHGGKIWAESEGAGKGSVFCLTLPLAN